jgi:hypothetical protein
MKRSLLIAEFKGVIRWHMKILGIILLMVGLLMIIAGGVGYQTEEELVDTGSIEISKKESKRLVWPWYAGGIAMVGGLIVLLMNEQRRKKRA